MRFLKHALFFVSLFALVTNGTAQTIDFSPSCLQAQEYIYQLRLKESSTLLEKASVEEKDNVVVDYLKVVSSMLDYVTSENNSTFIRFMVVRDLAIDRIKKCDDHNGYKDFLLEEIYFYSSVANGKKNKAVAAANDVRNAYNHGSAVLKNYPSFTAAKKTMGLLQSGFGSLPNSYQRMVRFLGYESNMNQGIGMLEDFINDKNVPDEWSLMQKEAAFYLASINLYLKNDKTTAWNQINALTSDYRSNPLSAFARVNFADKCKKNEEVIKTIRGLPTDNRYQTIPFLWFMMGKAKLQRLDKDANSYLTRFVNETEGESYLKSCYQKLSWHALIQGNEAKYKEYKSKILSCGSTGLEEDAQAQKFAKEVQAPNLQLLKTRMLYDGGYYKLALDIIRPLKSRNFETNILKTEYSYRKARIYDALGREDIATAFYKGAIERGKTLNAYYASYSALYLAEMYESNEQINEARHYFKMATTFSANKQYKKSIEHRAKSGLNRTK